MPRKIPLPKSNYDESMGAYVYFVDKKEKHIIGRSEIMRRVYASIDRAAVTDENVLIIGESGTGKEIVAEAIHYNSYRAKNPYIATNCGAKTRELINSELFGHVRGSFTGAIKDRRGFFEEADRGTLFLDEITCFPLDLQPTLLRVLQNKTFEKVGSSTPVKADVRTIFAASNIEEKIRCGSFRDDLYYRINVIPIYLPSLRERREDIPLLAEYFFKANRELRKDFVFPETAKELPFSKRTLSYLQEQSWPGNVRDLETLIKRMILYTESYPISLDTAKKLINLISEKQKEPSTEPATGSLKEVEKVHIIKVLEITQGKIKQAANILGIHRATLYKKLQKYRIKES